MVSDSTDLIAVQKNYQIALDRLDRYEKGHKNGLFSLTDLETRRLKVQEDYAKVIALENKLNGSRQELLNAQLDLSTIQADFQEKLAKAQSDRSSAVSYQAEAGGEMAKLQNKISSVDVRRGLYVVRAPQDGFVVRSLKAGIGEIIKEGESIATLQPANPAVAVELYVRPMDVPLIQTGRQVRLQFDGWPAIQFSGWPTVAVGTFGGEVAVIDAVNSVSGKYRLLIKPSMQKDDQPWPAQLRVGSGVFGWVMLDDVPVWYELWRQLNGFPPSLQEEPKRGEKEMRTIVFCLGLLMGSLWLSVAQAQPAGMPFADTISFSAAEFYRVVYSTIPLCGRLPCSTGRLSRQIMQARGAFDPKLFSVYDRKEFGQRSLLRQMAVGIIGAGAARRY